MTAPASPGAAAFAGLRYTFDPGSGRYRDTRGRYVSRLQVRQALDSALDNAGKRTATIADAYRTGQIGVRDFEARMRAVIKETQLYSAAAAKGGWERMTQRDYGAVGYRVSEQYAYLRRFTADLRAGLPLDGRFLLRVKRYAQAARPTYHAIERRVADEGGNDEERSTTHPADHCGECPAVEARGWQPIGTLPLPGERECGSGCKCTMSYRAAA